MKIDWVVEAKKKGYEINGVSRWVVSHGLCSYSAAKLLQMTQPTIYRWLHTPEKGLSDSACLIFRTLNLLDLKNIDSVEVLS